MNRAERSLLNLPNSSLRDLAAGLRGKPNEELRSIFLGPVLRGLNFWSCQTVSNMDLKLYVDESLVEYVERLLYRKLCGFEVLGVPDGLSRAEARNYVALNPCNPGFNWYTDYDVEGLRRNGGAGELIAGGKKNTPSDFIKVGDTLERAMREQIKDDIAVSVFPYIFQSENNAMDFTGNRPTQHRIVRPYMPRGLILESSESRNKGEFGTPYCQKYLEDFAYVLAAAKTVRVARSEVGRFIYHQSDMKEVMNSQEWLAGVRDLALRYDENTDIQKNSECKQKKGKGISSFDCSHESCKHFVFNQFRPNLKLADLNKKISRGIY